MDLAFQTIDSSYSEEEEEEKEKQSKEVLEDLEVNQEEEIIFD